MFLFNDAVTEVEFGRVQWFGGLIIAARRSHGLEWLKRPSGFEVLGRLRPCWEFLIGGQHGFVGITLPRLACGVKHDDRKKTGPVKVDGGIEVVAMEGVELGGPLLGEMA